RTGGPRRLVVPDVGGVAVAEAAVGARAPAAHRSGLQDGAHVGVPRRDGDRASPAQVHRAHRVGRLVVTDVPGAPQAELAAVVPAPAAHRTGRGDDAGGAPSRGDRHGRLVAEIDRPRAGRGLVV